MCVEGMVKCPCIVDVQLMTVIVVIYIVYILCKVTGILAKP